MFPANCHYCGIVVTDANRSGSIGGFVYGHPVRSPICTQCVDRPDGGLSDTTVGCIAFAVGVTFLIYLALEISGVI